MGTCFLCSRSELFRLLYIEAGSSMLFISPPDGFLDWFRRAIPSDHSTAGNLSAIPEGKEFDHIIMWTGGMDMINEENAGKLIGSYSGNGGVWIGLPVGDGPGPDDDGTSIHGLIIKGAPMNLSTEHDLFRALTEKDEDRSSDQT